MPARGGGIMGTWRDWLMEQLVDLPPDDDKQDDLGTRARAAVEQIARRALMEQEQAAYRR